VLPRSIQFNAFVDILTFQTVVRIDTRDNLSAQLSFSQNMKILVTGSAGHLGEALMRTLHDRNVDAIGLDLAASAFTHEVGSIADRAFVARAMKGVDAVIHTATLHKPHVITHTRQDFVDTNISGTLNLLEEAVTQHVTSFVFTSTTSVFGDAMAPPAGEPAVWVTEDLKPKPKNIYGVTKTAAEDLCELFHRDHGLACIVLRTSRFFPEDDDEPAKRGNFNDDNMKLVEYLYRRVDIEDAVDAHLLAIERASVIGLGRYIITATTPFTSADLPELNVNAPSVVTRYFPEVDAVLATRGWKMFPRIDRVYVNTLARNELGWRPKFGFAEMLARIKSGDDLRTPLARMIGAKGYRPK
jgi:UDP-glucose 4-epimerase